MRNFWLGYCITAGSALLLAAAPLTMTGCERTEEVLDVETPEGEVEVEKNLDTGATEVETDE